MPEEKIVDDNLETTAQEFQMPSDAPLPPDPDLIDTIPQNEISVNQLANQDFPPEQNVAASEAMNAKKNQADVFGKSELLNAQQILAQTLGMKNGDRVADLGAGGGLFTLQAARLVGDQGEVYAVDIMKTSLSDIESKARMANLYNIKTVWSDIEILGATKIPEATLDYVLLVNTLFQSNDPKKMLQEATRLLKTGGKMLIIDWSDTNSKLGPHSDKRIDPNNISSQALGIRLKLEQQFIAGQYHFGLVFVK